MKQPAPPTAYKIGMLLVLAMGVFVRAYHLGDKILWCDEGFVFHAATLPSVAAIQDFYRVEAHTTLATVINHYWIQAFGRSIAALHSESLIWSALTLFLLAWLAHRVFTWRVALGVTAALAVNAFVPEFAQLLRYPALAGFFSMAWLIALFMMLRTGKWPWLVLYTAGLVLSLFAHLFTLFTIMTLFACILLTRRRWGRLYVPLLISHAVPVAAIMPKLMLMRHSGVSSLAPGISLADAMRHLAGIPIGGLAEVAYSFMAGRYVNMRSLPAPVLAAILLAAAIIVVSSLFHKTYRFEARLCAAALAGSVLLGWAAMIFRGVAFLPHYYVPLVPLFCILLGIGIDAMRVKYPHAPGIAFVLYACMSLFFLNVYWSRINRPPNSKSIVAYVEAHARTGDFMNLSPAYPYFIEYYWHGSLRVTRFRPDYNLWHAPPVNEIKIHSADIQLTPAIMERWHKHVASHYDRVWMYWVLGTKNIEDGDRVAFQWMERHYERLQTKPVRMFPYSDEYTGEMVLYRIKGKRKPSSN